ncbi:hypothetical protein NQ317_006770 [Molorchus minor]|uniref:Endonuclease/exonuclease/phosphatase domain-containing protein n=1 Tax=Molorchus minor TaxID=1323400 RepID=A0ABQ9JML4_9CUCU|nr:hypothetical protein NQ317_006770 [Molorchus minor]
MTDFTISQREFLESLFLKLNTTIEEKATEIKRDITDKIENFENENNWKDKQLKRKINSIELENKRINKQVLSLERKTRKNNIVIFVEQLENENWADKLDEDTVEQAESKTQHPQIQPQVTTLTKKTKRQNEEHSIEDQNEQKRQKSEGITKDKMDPFIRDFKVKTIRTEELETTDELNKIISVNANYENLKVLHLNIRSIQKNFEELEILLYEISHEIDIILLTETWKIENPELYKLNGYNIIYNDGNYNQNDGVVLLIKEGLHFDYKIDNLGPIKVIRAELKVFEHHVDILCLYKSPALDSNEFLSELEYYLEAKPLNSCINLILGDINIDLLSGNNNITNEYLNLMSEHNFESTINKATRINGETGSCLDHIFIKTTNEIKDNTIPIILKK